MYQSIVIFEDSLSLYGERRSGRFASREVLARVTRRMMDILRRTNDAQVFMVDFIEVPADGLRSQAQS